VRAKDLRAIKLDEIRSFVYGYAGVFTKIKGGWLLSVGQNVEEGREHVERASRRHKVTPELLAKWPRSTMHRHPVNAPRWWPPHSEHRHATPGAGSLGREKKD
jgi:hypothetical protein